MDKAMDNVKLFFIELLDKKPEIAAWVFIVFIIIMAGIYMMNKKLNAEINQKNAADSHERELLDKMLNHNQRINDSMSKNIEKLTEATEACISAIQVSQNAIMKNTNQNEKQYTDIKTDIKSIETHISDIKVDLRDINTKMSSCLVRGDKK